MTTSWDDEHRLTMKMKPHFDGKRFHAPGGVQLASTRDVLRWALTRKKAKWPERMDNPPPAPIIDRLAGERLRVTFINHATVLIQGGGMNLITDPVFSERVSPLKFAGPRRHRAPGLSLEDLPPIDVILLSHTHYDHMDVDSLRYLHDVHDPLMICPLNAAHILERNVRKHNTHRGCVEMNWWDAQAVHEECTVTMVPAMHWTSRKPGDANKSLWGGYVIRLPGGSVYFAGDTGYADGQHFHEAREHLGPFRCALLPIGAYEPRWFMRPQHMNPEEAVKAFSDLQARHALGIHFGTFQLTDEAHDAPEAALHDALHEAGVSQDVFRTLGNGGAWDIP